MFFEYDYASGKFSLNGCEVMQDKDAFHCLSLQELDSCLHKMNVKDKAAKLRYIARIMAAYDNASIEAINFMIRQLKGLDK